MLSDRLMEVLRYSDLDSENTVLTTPSSRQRHDIGVSFPPQMPEKELPH